MHEMTQDEQLTKVAQERNVTPLTETFGIKLSEAEQMAEGVVQQGFFETMAKLGHVPQTEEEAMQMLNVATMLQHKLADVESESNTQVFGKAAAVLRDSLGLDSPEASLHEDQLIQDSYAKTADYVSDASVLQHMLARRDAQELLSN